MVKGEGIENRDGKDDDQFRRFQDGVEEAKKES
jgi:hypothetical protein